MATPTASRVLRIRKRPGAASVAPNLLDYEDARSSFSWATARAGLDALPGGGLSIAHTRTDRA